MRIPDNSFKLTEARFF